MGNVAYGYLGSVLLLSIALTGCVSAGGTRPTPQPLDTPAVPTSVATLPGLYPADSAEPAAGICEGWPESEVPIRITELSAEGVPSPRCMQVKGTQSGLFMNLAGYPVSVKFAWFVFTVEPQGTYPIEAPFETYLSVGVHNLKITAGPGRTPSAPAIWLRAD